MAIIKTYIHSHGTVTALYNFLVANGTDFFTNVVNNTDYVSCYVGDLEFLRIYKLLNNSSNGIRVTTNGGITQTIYSASAGSLYYDWAYKTANAIALSVYRVGSADASFTFSIVITKDNNNNTSVVVVGGTATNNTFDPQLTADNPVYVISTESELINTVVLRPNTGKYTTAFCPIIVSGTTMRYLPNVYYMPFSQYNIEGNFLIDDVVYLCNGLLAVKDE